MPNSRVAHALRGNQDVVFQLALTATFIFYASGSAAQTTFPTRPVRVVVPAAPGGGTDILARVLAQKLSETLGQQFVVDNKAGAGQIIGIESVMKAVPDGYTLLLAANAIAINQALYKKLSYDTLRDFAPITICASLPNILVTHPSLPANSVRELIVLAKAHPGKLNYASGGVGTSPHLSMELLRSMAHLEIVHIPYRGTGPALTDLLAGQVQMMMINILTALPHVTSGKLRAIGVSSAKRSTRMPEIPTIAESGVPGYESISWYGWLAPAGTPGEIIEKLHSAVVGVLQQSRVKEQLANDGAEVSFNRPDEFAAYIKLEIAKWTRLVKDAGITTE